MKELSIFVSYAREDTETAVRLYTDLKANGLKPWLDVECLRPGENWKRAIQQAIRDSRYFLALLSTKSVSKFGYVNKEISEALELLEMFPQSEVYVIPVRLDNCQPSYEKLSELHWVDLFPSWETGVTRIVNSISKDVKFRDENRLASETDTTTNPVRSRITSSDTPIINDSPRKSILPADLGRTTLIPPQNYIIDRGLQNAVNVALASEQPLLVTGEPGVGKTQLASSVAYELGFGPPLIFRTKTTSTASDLLYSYDAALRLHDLQVKVEQTPAENYLNFGALGIAILLSLSPDKADPYLPLSLRGTGPQRNVVLIDSIDNASRDLPNDILDEIDAMAFSIKEIGQTFVANPNYRPVVIFTSNSEKELPDAFLSRCIYYQIPFPDLSHLMHIVTNRLGGHLSPKLLQNSVEHFLAIRQLSLRKRPTIVEFFTWIQFLAKNDIDVGDLKADQTDMVVASYSILAKNSEDIFILRSFLEKHLSRTW